MNFVRLCTALLCSVALSSCGGGGSSSGGGTPAPSPSPSPSPTPSPTPTFAYSRLADLTGDQNFPAACVGHRADGVGVRAITDQHPFAADNLLTYAAGSQSWTAKIPDFAEPLIFGSADAVGSTTSEIRYAKVVNGRIQQDFTILRPSVAGVAAEYGRLSSLNYAEPGSAATGDCVFGVPTNPADLPATVSYSNLRIDGTVFDLVGSTPQASRVTGGSGTIVGNTATGKVQVSLFYEVTAPDGTVTTVGPVEETMDLVRANGLAGYFAHLGAGAIRYQVQGGFLGPQAVETGFVAVAFFDLNSDGANEKLVILRVFARR